MRFKREERRMPELSSRTGRAMGTGGLLLSLLFLLAAGEGLIPVNLTPEELRADGGPAARRGPGPRKAAPGEPPGIPSLHLAARRGRSGTVEELLSRGHSPDTVDRFGATPLMVGARRNHRGVVRQLLEAGASTEARDRHGSTPLMYAASGGHPETLRILIESGARVEAESPSGATALFDAALEGHERSVKLLLEHGANPDRWDRVGGTPFSRALLADHPKVARKLLRRSDSPARQARSTPALVHAAHHGRVGLTRRLLELGGPSDGVYWYGTPPLVAAARERNTRVVKMLLEAGSSPDVRTRRPAQPGVTPLMAAVMITYQPFRLRGGKAIIRELLHRGASLEAREDAGSMTPLMYASQVNPSILKLLLEHGADPYRTNSRGQSTLDLLRMNTRPFPSKIVDPYLNRPGKSGN